MSDWPPLPERFVARLAEIVPPERLPACLASFAAEKPTALRLNPLRGDVAATRAELQAAGFSLQGVPWLDTAWLIPAAERRRLTESPAVTGGRAYIQNLASMTAAVALAPQPGEEVLDLCAAPGGKTLHLAALMQGAGRLAAVESVRERFFRLRANLERYGAPFVPTYLADGRSIGRKTPGRFDRVLLDAPCSSEARFTRLDPDSWRYWSEKKIAEAARKQRGLVRSAWEALRPGGRLLYCTCSLAPEENEQIADDLLRDVGDEAEVATIDLPLANRQPGLAAWRGAAFDPRLARSVRLLPTDTMDACYLCLLAKRGA